MLLRDRMSATRDGHVPGRLIRLMRSRTMTDLTCSIEGCDQEPCNGRGWCQAHYTRWHRHGDPLAGGPSPRTGCLVEGCDRKHHGHGYCKNHRRKWRRNGDPGTDLTRAYRGDDITYTTAHSRLRQQRGPASERTCIDCGGQAADWSYRGGSPKEIVGVTQHGYVLPWSPDPADYDPRCRNCHRNFDLGRVAP